MPLERWIQMPRLRLRSLVLGRQLDDDLSDELQYGAQRYQVRGVGHHAPGLAENRASADRSSLPQLPRALCTRVPVGESRVAAGGPRFRGR